MLNGSFMFNLDALPVKFGPLRVIVNEDNPEKVSHTILKSELNVAMRDLNEIIWRKGGFRFKHVSTNSQALVYTYHCSQDLARAKPYQSEVEPEKRREGKRMERFPCQSKLTMRVCVVTRTLFLTIRHMWHPPYEEVQVPPEVRDLISSRASTNNVSEILREIRNLPEARSVTRHQVYYLWKKAKGGTWAQQSDESVSTTALLPEDSNCQDSYAFSAGDVRDLSPYAPGIPQAEYVPRAEFDYAAARSQQPEDNPGPEVMSETEQDTNDDRPFEVRYAEFKDGLQKAMSILDEQAKKQNWKFVKEVMKTYESLFILAKELQHHQRYGTDPKTYNYNHPAMKYVQ